MDIQGARQMIRRHQNYLGSVLVILLIATISLAACSPQAAEPPKLKPAQVESIGETGQKRVILTARAAERLGIQTVTISDQVEVVGDASSSMPIPNTGSSTEPINQSNSLAGDTQEPGLVQWVPYSAVIYDINGNTWVYLNPDPLVFVRQAISVERIDGDRALISENLPAGTKIVTVGVIELYGTETGVGK